MGSNNKRIEFKCLEEKCKQAIYFGLLEVEKDPHLKCPHCKKEYCFNGNFVSEMKKFDNLICAIKDAEDILSDTNVAINFKKHELRLPYRLLLTRMNTLLTLKIGDDKITFRFRIEPLGEETNLAVKK